MTAKRVGDRRLLKLHQWLEETIATAYKIEPVAGDASFRRYFRVTTSAGRWVVMDAPPEREPLRPFLKVASLLADAGLHAPSIEAIDEMQGFLLLEDLGSRLYLTELNDSSADALYGAAMTALIRLQQLQLSADQLPRYDAALLQQELDLFYDWFLVRHLHSPLSAEFNSTWQQGCQLLIDSALEQPQVVVHRDYHSRNLLLVEHHTPAIIDFQDALIGPVSYDLVSLLRDCYIDWPQPRIMAWFEHYSQQARQQGILDASTQPQQLVQWFDWMGVQRHMKAIGIFCRLNYRDHKAAYMADIPRTWGYLARVMGQYSELQPLWQLLNRLYIREGGCASLRFSVD
ncbi:aminoglycoside phosphotransferase [Ectothiorhodospiraceae bacterium BW-2]|nr:aminoglycoside phosphotransferase [Ectothiorhodospiraceae bacterium BW-2]